MFIFIDDGNKNPKAKSIFWGSVLVLIGILFLLRNLEIIPFEFPDQLINWRIIFVIFTMNAVISQNWNKAILWGGFTIILYAPILFNVDLLQFKYIWPVVLIAIGLFIMGKVKIW